jgi:hypothetical protein
MHPALAVVANNTSAVADNNRNALQHCHEKVIKAIRDYL